MSRLAPPPVVPRGFTLLELMAALAVFAVIATMAHGALHTLLETRRAGERRMEALAAWQWLFTQLGRDIEQSVPRFVIDGGNRSHPALRGGSGGVFFLELTHTGHPNPGGAARSALQRVAWSREEGRIRRHAWPTLDRVAGDDPGGVVLLDGAGSVEIRFLGRDGRWREVWPEPGAGDGATMLPRAVEIVVEKRGWGRMRRLFEVGGGG
ncbi:MAG: type II secretion system minor pseudopilin GspJ [Magnetococcales bacterium]|nr:type II secretion system minor pseudopilin GspJ [Magnetococcales bacterium]